MSNEPRRTLPLAIEILAPIYKDKIVCELGCGTGSTMELFINYGAKKCIGIEILSELVEIARKKKLMVIEGDVCSIKIPKADEYYNWTPLPTATYVINRIKKGIIICGHMPHLNEELDKYGGVRINVPCEETEWDSTNFEITIIKK